MKEFFKEFFAKVEFLQFVVAITVMFTFVAITMALIYHEIPAGNKDSLGILLGLIAGAVMAIVGYYYGSSKGSQKKSDTIDEISKQITDKLK